MTKRASGGPVRSGGQVLIPDGTCVFPPPSRTARVVSDPDIHGGTPILSGTRIPARTVASLAADGCTAKEISGFYPGITPEHVKAAIEWADRAHCEGHGGTGGVWYCCEHPKAGWPCPEIGSGTHHGRQ